MSTFKLDDVFSDVFGKSSRSIIDYILEHPGKTFDITPFTDKHYKKSIEEIQTAVDRTVSHKQAAKLKECLYHIDEIKAHKRSIELKIYRLAEPYAYPLELLRTILEFSSDTLTAIAIISETDADMSVFPSAKHLSLIGQDAVPVTIQAITRSNPFVFQEQVPTPSPYSFKWIML